MDLGEANVSFYPIVFCSTLHYTVVTCVMCLISSHLIHSAHIFERLFYARASLVAQLVNLPEMEETWV